MATQIPRLRWVGGDSRSGVWFGLAKLLMHDEYNRIEAIRKSRRERARNAMDAAAEDPDTEVVAAAPSSAGDGPGDVANDGQEIAEPEPELANHEGQEQLARDAQGASRQADAEEAEQSANPAEHSDTAGNIQVQAQEQRSSHSPSRPPSRASHAPSTYARHANIQEQEREEQVSSPGPTPPASRTSPANSVYRHYSSRLSRASTLIATPLTTAANPASAASGTPQAQSYASVVRPATTGPPAQLRRGGRVCAPVPHARGTQARHTHPLQQQSITVYHVPEPQTYSYSYSPSHGYASHYIPPENQHHEHPTPPTMSPIFYHPTMFYQLYYHDESCTCQAENPNLNPCPPSPTHYHEAGDDAPIRYSEEYSHYY